MTPDRLKLLVIPGLSRVTILWQPDSLQEATFKKTLAETEVVGRSLGIHTHVVEVPAVTDIDAAFSDWRAVPRGSLLSTGIGLRPVRS